MTTEESKDPRYKEGKEECYINYSLTELWELIDNIRLRCSAYTESQERAILRGQGNRHP